MILLLTKDLNDSMRSLLQKIKQKVLIKNSKYQSIMYTGTNHLALYLPR